MFARDIRVGDVVEGFGRVESVVLNHQEQAIKGPTNRIGLKFTKGLPFNALFRAKLAEEALEHVYARVPVSVTLTSGPQSRTIDLDEQVQVSEYEVVARAA